MKILFIILLSLALILETSLTTLPLVLLTLLVLTAVFKDNFLFIMALIFGSLLDLMLFKTIGLSGIFFIFVIFLALLYQSKFEIATNTFVIFTSIMACFIFLLLNGVTSNIILETVVSTVLGWVMFESVKHFKTATLKKND